MRRRPSRRQPCRTCSPLLLIVGGAPPCAASFCFAPAGSRDVSRPLPLPRPSVLPSPNRTARLATASVGRACSVAMCPRRTARPRASPSHVLVQRRRRALLLYLYSHHRWLGRRRHLPPASSLPSPIAVRSLPAAVRRTARLAASLDALWHSEALRAERIAAPPQPCAREDCRRRSHRRWTLTLMNSYSPLAQHACWRLSAPAKRAARARSRKRRTPPATSTPGRRVPRRAARRR